LIFNHNFIMNDSSGETAPPGGFVRKGRFKSSAPEVMMPRMGAKEDRRWPEIGERLRRNISEARAYIEAAGPVAIRERRGGAALSPLEAAVAMYKTETEMIRPAINLMLERDAPALPEYDPVAAAEREGFNAYDPRGLLRGWASVRNATIMQAASLDEAELKRPGLARDGEITIRSLLLRWAEEDDRLMAMIRVQLAG